MAQTTQFSVTLTLSLASGWKEFPEAQYSPPTVTRQGDVVVLEGLVTGGGTVIANLPEGFRPSKRLIFPANTHEASCRVDVLANGVVQYAAGPVPHKWISLSGITFTTKEKYAGLPTGGNGGSTGGDDDEEEDAGLLLCAYRWDGKSETYSPKCTFVPGSDVVPAIHEGRRGVYVNPTQSKPTKAPTVGACEFDQINFTFTAWVNITGAPADRWLLADWTKPWKFYFHFTPNGADYQFGGELRRNLPLDLGNFGSEPSQGLVTAKGGVIKVGVWTHVAWVWNRQTGVATLYVNGSKVADATVPAAYKNLTGALLCPNNDVQDNDHAQWELGWKGDEPAARHFDGWVADLEIRGRALTAEQVKHLADDAGDVDVVKPTAPAKWDIPEGSKWRYDHWGGVCTALWQPNGELWMALNPASTNGTCVWKTTDGDGKRLVGGDAIKVLWDNKGRQNLVVTDINTITVNGTYHFIREPKITNPTPVVEPAKPVVPVATVQPRFAIPQGSKWRYGPWGGLCTALWQPNGELWMAINPASTNGTCVWKTQNGDAKKLLAGETIKIQWDNRGSQDLVVTNVNTLTRTGGYKFIREPAVPAPPAFKFEVPEGSKWKYDPWGGVCTAQWQTTGELWLAIDLGATNGTRVWKTTGGDWAPFLAGQAIKILWDNVDRQNLQFTDAKTITVNGSHHFIRQ